MSLHVTSHKLQRRILVGDKHEHTDTEWTRASEQSQTLVPVDTYKVISEDEFPPISTNANAEIARKPCRNGNSRTVRWRMSYMTASSLYTRWTVSHNTAMTEIRQRDTMGRHWRQMNNTHEIDNHWLGAIHTDTRRDNETTGKTKCKATGINSANN